MELYKWTIASIALGYLMTHRQRLPLEPQSVELEPTLPVAQKWGTWATTMSQDMAISGKCWLKNQHFGGSLVSDKFQTNPDIWEKRGKRPQLVDVVCWWWGPGVSDWNRGHYSSWRAAVDSVLQSSVSETAQMRRCVTSPAKATDSWPFFLASKEPSCPWTASAGCQESTGWITSHDIWEWVQILDQGTVDLGHFQCQPFILYPTLTHPTLEDFWSDQLDQGAKNVMGWTAARRFLWQRVSTP
jgi:hypothetical protein